MKITEKLDKTQLILPKNTHNLGELQLVLLSNSTNKEYNFSVEDTTNYSDYYTFEVDFTEVPDGEYNYYVKVNDEILAKGLMYIDCFKNNNTEYIQNNKYIVYTDD